MIGEAIDVINEYNEYCQQEIYGKNIKLRSIEAIPKELKTKKKKVDPDIQINFYESIAHSDGWSTGAAEILAVGMTRTDGTPLLTIIGGERVVLTIRARVDKNLNSPIVGFFVKDRLGQSLFGEHTYTYTQPVKSVESGQFLTASFTFEMPMLPNGDYSITASIADGDPHVNMQHHWLHDALILTVNSPKLRYGLVGIQFEEVLMEVNNGG
jgi:lipopolysaccharide transport system ATP-binding protein